MYCTYETDNTKGLKLKPCSGAGGNNDESSNLTDSDDLEED